MTHPRPNNLNEIEVGRVRWPWWESSELTRLFRHLGFTITFVMNSLCGCEWIRVHVSEWMSGVEWNACEGIHEWVHEWMYEWIARVSTWMPNDWVHVSECTSGCIWMNARMSAWVSAPACWRIRFSICSFSSSVASYPTNFTPCRSCNCRIHWLLCLCLPRSWCCPLLDG